MNRLNAKVTLMGSASPLVASKLSKPLAFPFFVFAPNCCEVVSDKPTENNKREPFGNEMEYRYLFVVK